MSFTTLIDAAALLGLSGDVVLLDCRFDLRDPAAGRRAFDAAHVPGARYADLNRDLSAPVTASSGRHPLPEPAALARFFGSLGLGGESQDATQVVVYDEANGSIAARAWWLFNWLGHGRVAVLDGGLEGWLAAGGPVESGPAAARMPAIFTPRPRTGGIVQAAQVSSACVDPRRILVDARAPERFSGSVEPLDPVAGHIPGAVNHPFTANLAADGHFLPVAELRQRWLERLDGRAPRDLIAMCGSGVTACHNLLAMAHAGLPGAELYAGSWSEWIRDPNRPVARDGVT